MAHKIKIKALKVDFHIQGIDLQDVHQSLLVLRSLNHKLRQRILKLLEEHSKLTVSKIQLKLGIEQSIVSQHPGILREAGVVNRYREGKYIFYKINSELLIEIGQILKKLLSATGRPTTSFKKLTAEM